MPECPNCGYDVNSTFGRTAASHSKMNGGGKFGKKYKCEKCGFAFSKDSLKRIGNF
jgi:predicted RNA-binding Zn-ribbon protein involved in translation (DUF1610 family)